MLPAAVPPSTPWRAPTVVKAAIACSTCSRVWAASHTVSPFRLSRIVSRFIRPTPNRHPGFAAAVSVSINSSSSGSVPRTKANSAPSSALACPAS